VSLVEHRVLLGSAGDGRHPLDHSRRLLVGAGDQVARLSETTRQINETMPVYAVTLLGGELAGLRC